MAKPRGRKPKHKDKYGKDFDVNRKYFYKDDIFLSRMASILRMSKKEVRAIFSHRTVSAIRVNNLVEEPKKIVKFLKKKGLELEEVPWAENAYIVLNRDKSDLGKMDAYERGLFYMQNLSSMLPSVILDPKPDEKILDMCAAPGSKTTHIASILRNDGDILANDNSINRVQKLQNVLKQFGVNNTEVYMGDGGEIHKQYANHFDKVLLDAPCSSEGLLYLRRAKALRFWSIKKVKAMIKKQTPLIDAAFRSLKPGGLMIYSTCTLEPDENEGVVSELLRKHSDAVIEDIDLVFSDEFKDYLKMTRPGIQHWNKTDYHPDVVKTLRVVPGSKMQGFYIAKIRKTK